MITGFNTDVEHDGVVYHVQTEDKGLDTPIILSLVYTGGAILASKRSPYQDLIASGFDEAVLSDRLKRQHTLICAAIRAGRVADLRRMASGTGALRASEVKEAPADLGEVTLEPDHQVDLESEPVEELEESEHPPSTDVTVAELEDGLRVSLVEEQEFKSGETLNLGVLVTRKSAKAENPVSGVSVSVKVLGTTFRPVIVSVKTAKDGIAQITTSIPSFSSGRAALLVRAVRGGESVEIRRVVHPTQ